MHTWEYHITALGRPKAGHVARTGERKCVYRVVVGEPEGKRLLGRLRLRWEVNIKMDRLCILIVVYVFLDAATLTEVFP